MKVVYAMLRPEQLPAVKNALFDAQIYRFTVMNVMGTAPRTEQLMFRGVEKQVSLFQRLRLEVIVNDSLVEKAIAAITQGGNETGGHGRIFVIELKDSILVWNGMRGPQTLS
jgi:nitrogen regulatory protein P-II 1